jgi:hypothetical protein
MARLRQFMIDQPEFRTAPLGNCDERSAGCGAGHFQSNFFRARHRRRCRCGLHFPAQVRLMADSSAGARQQVIDFRPIRDRRR